MHLSLLLVANYGDLDVACLRSLTGKAAKVIDAFTCYKRSFFLQRGLER